MNCWVKKKEKKKKGIKHEATVLKHYIWALRAVANLPLVQYCIHLFEKYLFGFHSADNMETEYELIHKASDKPVLRNINIC
jgi:hypothetical protein